MSPGVLLSTGYIAGGAIAGVLIAFLSFSDEIPKQLGVWQFHHYAVPEAKPLPQEYEDAAVHELGTRDAEAGDEVQAMAKEIREINEDLLPQYVHVPRGAVLTLPGGESYTTEEPSTLGEIARQLEGSKDKASLLFDLNSDRLKLPDRFPVGAELKLPQRNAPALAAFAILAAFLVVVGLGWFLSERKPSDAVIHG